MAKDELQEGVAALTERQKMIRLTNSAENSCGAVRKYKGLNEFADNKDTVIPK